MKNILYIPTRYFPSISGAEFYFQRMAEILTFKYKYNIDIYTSNAIDFKGLRHSTGRILTISDKFYENVNNLKIKRFPINYNLSLEEKVDQIKKIKAYSELNLSDICLKNFIGNGPYLENAINDFFKKQDFNYDLIHTTFFPYFNLIISLIFGTHFKIPVILTPFFHFSNPRYLDPHLTEILGKFDLLIACTKIEKNILTEKIGIPEKKITVIPMGVDFERFSNNNKFNNYNFKQHYFRVKEKNYKMVLYCGNKNFEKGAVSVLKAIPFILKKNKNVYFVMIGPPTQSYNRELSKINIRYRKKIINLTPNNLKGYFDKKKIAAFKETDIYLMPSRSDAFGIAFLEAWASGKPVIGANTGATPEIIKDSIDGLLVEFDNPKDISEKVLKLLRKNRLRYKLGSAGKKKVKQYYQWDFIAEETHKTYKTIIKYINKH